MKNSRKYHFFPARLSQYSENNFKDLLEEFENYGKYIYWKISNENGKYLHSVKKNDICYIYYSCLPDESSRILFEGTVEQSDFDVENRTKSICPDSENGILYAKLTIKSISLEDKDKFSLDKLRNDYKFISEKGQIGYRCFDCNIEDHKRLIKDLSDSAKNGIHYLKKVNEYFENFCCCEFKGVDKKRNHNTFKKENGYHYIERHHLVERNLIKKYVNEISDIDKLIEQENNIFSLCPNCHMEIHHGQKERKREKIEYLYNKNKDFFDNNFNQLKNNKTTLEWLFDIYKCN